MSKLINSSSEDGAKFTGSARQIADLSAVNLAPQSVDKGGTGISVYALGDLLYASAPTTLTRLAKGSSGQVLASTSSIPQWVEPSNAAAEGAVMAVEYDSNSILAANTSDTPVAVQIGEQRIVGRKTGGNIDDLTATEVRTILNVEDGANATDAANVAAAGAVLEADTTTASMAFVLDEDNLISDSSTKLATQQSIRAYVDSNLSASGAVMDEDYNANTILAANIDNTPAALTVAEDTIVGRREGGNINDLSPAEARTILNVEDGAASNQTAAEIKTSYESNANTNAYTDAEKTKLGGVEANASGDQTAAEIKTAYESNSDTNEFADAEKTKLSGIADSAEVNVQPDWDQATTGADDYIQNKPTTITSGQASAITANTAKVTNVTTDLSVVRDGSKLEVRSSDGTDAVLPLADTDNWGVMSDEMFDKHTGIESGADVTDATNVAAAGAVMEADFAAASFLYATSDDTPQPKTPSEVRTILNIEDGATADQTGAEIRTAVEAASDSNVFTDADHTKLNGIEASATADQTNAEIRVAVEAATDSNVFTDSDHTKLNGISGTNTGDEPDASLTVKGIVELATTTETTTGTDATRAVTPAGVQAAVDALVDAAPGALDTLNELAAAIGDDASYATTVTNALAAKAPIASPTFTGTVAIPNISNLETAVTANTAKVTNVSTDLSVSRDGTKLDVVSSDGNNAVLPLADTDNWGVISDEMFDDLTANTAKVGITSGQASAITANTAKVTNVSTDLSVSRDGTKLDVVSSDGNNAVLPLADTDNWGVMSDEMFDELTANTAKTGITSGQASAITANTAKVGITSGQASAIVANTAKVTNVSTDLSVSRDGTKLDVVSSDGNNAVLPLADTDNWGVMSDDMFDEHTVNNAKTGITSGQASAITANTAKVTNATHTGEVTGDGALTIADDIVDEANLKADNSPVNDYVLTAKSSAAGGLTWAAGGGGGGSGHTVQDEGNTLATETNLNFVGELVTATAESGASQVTVDAKSLWLYAA